MALISLDFSVTTCYANTQQACPANALTPMHRRVFTVSAHAHGLAIHTDLLAG